MRVDRLDRAVAGTLAGLAIVAVFLLFRGDQVGARVLQTSPANGAQAVALRPVISIVFSEPMLPGALDGRLRISPTVTGSIRWAGSAALFSPATPLEPDTAYTLTILAGAASARGRLVREDVPVVFSTSRPRLVYLAPATGVANLMIADVEARGVSRVGRLTSEPFGVYDFAVSPDGSQIAYSAVRDAGGSRDLFLIGASGENRRKIVTCDLQHCQSPAWSADGNLIAFERRTLDRAALGVTPGPSRLWLYDAQLGQATSLFTDTQVIASSPRWSTIGNTLTFYDNIQSILTVLDIRTGDLQLVPSLLGDAPAWSPDGGQFLYADLLGGADGRFQKLLRFDAASNTITPAMGLDATNDYGATWAPSGSAFAFGRQTAASFSTSGGGAFFGPQIWVADAAGIGARALTTDTEYSHAGLAWGPDGRWIAFVRTNLRVINPLPEIWLIRPDGSGARSIAVDATLPAWVP